MRKILDMFELVDDLEALLDFKEVCSRQLLFEEEISAEEAVEYYSLDK